MSGETENIGAFATKVSDQHNDRAATIETLEAPYMIIRHEELPNFDSLRKAKKISIATNLLAQ